MVLNGRMNLNKEFPNYIEMNKEFKKLGRNKSPLPFLGNFQMLIGS
jgi:hypothetical protein